MKSLISSLLLLFAVSAHAQKGTVCTITVNSPDEKQTFRQHLPQDKWDFVELVEPGRKDWLETACRKQVKCDLLIISGHFSPGTGFYPEEAKTHENLRVEEMERVSCSESCPSLFSGLKEVYMFGCNTLNINGDRQPPGEAIRGLLRAGYSQQQAERIAHEMAATHGESSSDQMRRIFPNVPAIYGFGAAAPLGPYAAGTLHKFFRSAMRGEIGSGQISRGLLSAFSANSMRAVPGLSPNEKAFFHRREVCNFFDKRLSAGAKTRFVGQVLQRNSADLRLFFPRIEKFMAELTDAEKAAPDFANALAPIAADQKARANFLRLAHDADQIPVRMRMLKVARRLNWLSDQSLREESFKVINELIAKGQVEPRAADLVCALNHELGLHLERYLLELFTSEKNLVGQKTIAACVGAPEGYGEMLALLTHADPRVVEYAQVYFRHNEMRPADVIGLIERIRASTPASTQVMTLETIGKLYVSDTAVLHGLLAYFTKTNSLEVQQAIAGVLIRARYDHIDKRVFANTLSQRRIRSSGGRDAIDFAIRRLELP